MTSRVGVAPASRGASGSYMLKKRAVGVTEEPAEHPAPSVAPRPPQPESARPRQPPARRPERGRAGRRAGEEPGAALRGPWPPPTPLHTACKQSPWGGAPGPREPALPGPALCPRAFGAARCPPGRRAPWERGGRAGGRGRRAAREQAEGAAGAAGQDGFPAAG